MGCERSPKAVEIADGTRSLIALRGDDGKRRAKRVVGKDGVVSPMRTLAASHSSSWCKVHTRRATNDICTQGPP